MALHPGHHQRGQALVALPSRPRERVAGGVFRAVTRVAGFHTSMIPEHMRRQLRLIGVGDAQLERVLPRLRSLGDWPYAWEAEGDACVATGDWPSAFAAYYVSQRILLAPSPLKLRLYRLAVDAYRRVDQPRLERFDVPNEQGERVAGYLQLPPRAAENAAVPCVLIVPGITGTKEELHEFAQPLLQRGLAVARIDNPLYGETEGVLDAGNVPNARVVLEHLAADPRLDAGGLHLYGMSLGANFAVHAAVESRAATLTVICPPYEPGRYFRSLPTLNLTALQHMTQRRDLDDLMRFVSESSLVDVAPKLSIPLRVFHAGRDRTIPVEDGYLLARSTAGPAALTVFERDHHNCLEHLDVITARVLEFIRDPHAVCARAPHVEVIDSAASIHLTDSDAEAAHAGGHGSRQLARLPFLLPGARPRSRTQPATT